MTMEVQFPVNVLIMDVFKALLQDRVQELAVELMSVVEVFRALSQDRVHQLLVELMFVTGFVAGSPSRLAPEVAASSRPARVAFSGSLSRGTTTFPEARSCRTRSGWVLTGSWKLMTSRCDEPVVSGSPSARQRIQLMRQNWWLLVFSSLSLCAWLPKNVRLLWWCHLFGGVCLRVPDVKFTVSWLLACTSQRIFRIGL